MKHRKLERCNSCGLESGDHELFRSDWADAGVICVDEDSCFDRWLAVVDNDN